MTHRVLTVLHTHQGSLLDSAPAGLPYPVRQGRLKRAGQRPVRHKKDCLPSMRDSSTRPGSPARFCSVQDHQQGQLSEETGADGTG